MDNPQSENADVAPQTRETAGTKLAAKKAAKAAKKAASRGTTNPVEQMASSVQSSLRRVGGFLEQNLRLVAFVAAGVLVLGVGYALVLLQLGKTATEAGALLRSAITTSEGIVVGENATPPEEAPVPVFSSAEERDEKALEGYRTITSKFGDTNAGRFAKLGEANALFSLGKHAEASAAFTALLDAESASKQDDTFLRLRALEGLGYALEAQGKHDEALERFAELGKLEEGAYKIVGEYHRARVLVAKGRRDEARKVLETQLKAAAVSAGKEPDRFPSITEAAQTLVQELGGQAPGKEATGGFNVLSFGGEGGSNPMLTKQVMEALQKQLEAQQNQQPAPSGAEP